MKKALWLLVVLAGFMAGCENKYKDPDPQAMGYDYFPMEVGAYRVYAVTDVKYFNNESVRTTFQIRERVEDSFQDQTNQLVYKVIRSVRASNQNAWLDDSVMTVIKDDSKVLLTKDNTRYVKMVFPVKEGGEWIGDLFNSKYAEDNRQAKVRDGKEVYTYEQVGQTYTEQGLNFPRTVKVVQNSPEVTSIRVDNRFEVYAEGVGLIHRVFDRKIFKTCATEICDDDTEIVESGHERHEVLIEHGKL